MLGLQVNSLYLHSFHSTETYLIQDKNSCMAGDACIHFDGLIQLDAEAPIINKEISVAQAALVFIVFAYNEIFLLVTAQPATRLDNTGEKLYLT